MADLGKICGVVVLYNPDKQVQENIASYVSYLNTLFVVDNSEAPNPWITDIVTKIPNCKYIFNGRNLGIAAALNIGAKGAITNNATWLLTMDQDSKFEGDNLDKLIAFVSSRFHINAGIVSPYHRTKLGVIQNKEVEEVITVMTSGNLVNLSAYQIIGGFNEDLFIDAVDWDFCLQMNLAGFKVLRINTSFLEHNLGNATHHTAFSRKEVIVLNYNKIRRYYITRNKLYIIAKYRKHFPGYCKAIFKTLFRDLRHIVLYENNKLVKLKYFGKGVFDFLRNRKGKLS